MRTYLVALAMLCLALSAQAKKNIVEFYPGVEGYVSSPDITYYVDEYMIYDGYAWVDIHFENTTAKDVITFTKLDFFKPGYDLGILVDGPLKCVAYKGRQTAFLDSLSVRSEALAVKMKDVWITELRCDGLKRAQLLTLGSLIQKGDGYPGGAVVKVGEYLGAIDGHNPYFTGCIKSISAKQICCAIGYKEASGGNPVSTPKVLSLKAKEQVSCIGFSLLPGVAYKAKNVEVEVVDIPTAGDYMRVDLENGQVQKGLEAPETWGEIDKTRYLWLRHIKGGTFTMGSPEDEPWRCENENEHQVTLTRDFYAGVFELTEAQLKYITGSGEDSVFSAFPLTYDDLRGGNEGARFPASTQVDSDSIIGRLRSLTGCDFDLPTEAQWEYACKSGTHGTWNDGSAIILELEDGHFQDANLARLGWFDAAIHRVGLLEPNLWGLYDMHGNAQEMCLDWYQDKLTGPATDPAGPASGEARVVRSSGTNWIFPTGCRSASRASAMLEEQSSGARIFLTE